MKNALLIVLATVALAACGGGGGDEAPPVADDGTSVPASVAGSTGAWLQYTSTLPESDSAEPKSLEKIETAPTSETEEPVDLV
jgi:predicted small lipoprotein YifL